MQEDTFEDEERVVIPRPKAQRLGGKGDGRVDKRQREREPRMAPITPPQQTQNPLLDPVYGLRKSGDNPAASSAAVVDRIFRPHL